MYLQAAFKTRSHLLSQQRSPTPVGWERTVSWGVQSLFIFLLCLRTLNLLWPGLLCCQQAGLGGVSETDAAQGGGSSARVVSAGTNPESLLWDGGWEQGWRLGKHREAMEISAPQLSPWIFYWPVISYVWLHQTKGNLDGRNLNAAPYVRAPTSVGSWQP